MLSKLFKRRRGSAASLDHDDCQQRLQALAELNEPTPEQLQQIAQLARQDADPDVRRAAIARCLDIQALAALLDDEPVADAAARRIIAIDADHELKHPRLLSAKLASGRLPDIETLQSVDPEVLIDMLIASRGDAREELLGMPALQAQSVLVVLEKRSRNKDKTLNRLARDRLDTGKQLLSAYTTQYERSDELLNALDKHLNGDPIAAGYRDKHQQLCNRLDAAVAELTAAATKLEPMGITAEGIESLLQRVANVPQPTDLSAAQPDTRNPFIALIDTARTLERDLREVANVDELLGRFTILNDEWLRAAEQSTPDDAAHSLYAKLARDCQQLAEASAQLKHIPTPEHPALPDTPPEQVDAAAQYWRQVAARTKWLKKARKSAAQLRWPAWAVEPPQLNQLREAISTDTGTLESIEAWAEARLKSLNTDTQQLSDLISAGETKAAQTLLANTRAALRALPGSRVEQLNRHLNQLAAKLGELKDWQVFATTPKREHLCSQMQQLADSPLPAADQAGRIKTLRKAWNELGTPGSAADRSLADQFNSLAEQAFEPCRLFYAEQAQQREDNRIAREAICEQLEAYLGSTDFSNTDIKSAEQILRTARSEWQRFHPVERKLGKPLETRFEKLQESLYGHIKAAWEINLAAKTAVVDAARELLVDTIPAAERVNTAKDLQQRWQRIGPTPRRPDQQLWQEFRKICDQIFTARDEEKQQVNQALEQDRQTATTLLNEFEAGLAGPFDGAALRRFETDFAQLPALPDRVARALQQRYDALHSQAEKTLREQAVAKRAQGLLDELDAEISASTGDSATAEFETLQRLTIEAEIAAGVESPAEDRDLRMTIQVELMNAGKGQQALAAKPKDLVNTWLAAGPKTTDHEALQRRFRESIAELSIRSQ